MENHTEQEQLFLLEAESLIEQGNIEEAECFYDNAMEFYKQAMSIYETINHPKGNIAVSIAIAKIFQNKAFTVVWDLIKLERST